MDARKLSDLSINISGIESMIEALNDLMRTWVEDDINTSASLVLLWHPSKPVIVNDAVPLIPVSDKEKDMDKAAVLGFQGLFDTVLDNDLSMATFYTPASELIPVMTKLRSELEFQKEKLGEQIKELTK